MKLYVDKKMKVFTDWIEDSQDEFDCLRENILDKAKQGMEFFNNLNDDDFIVRGYSILYNSLDGDSWNEKDFSKWLVEITFLNEEEVSENIEGLYPIAYYELKDIIKDQITFYGTLEDCWEKLEELYPNIDFENKEELLKIGEKYSIEFDKEILPIELK